MTTDNPQDRKIRCFLGVAPQAALRHALANYQHCLKPLLSTQQLRWTQTGNLHLTLKFMGNLDHGQLSALTQHLSFELEECGRFTALLEEIQWFPSAREPRVIALSSAANTKLHTLATHCDKASQKIGVPANNGPFRGHITLARNKGKGPANHPLKQMIEPLELQVNRVSVFQSHLTAGGAIYTPLSGIDLK